MQQYFSFFVITFCIGFMRTGRKYVKVIGDDVCNTKIEFKAKSEMMKRNRNYKTNCQENMQSFKM